MRHDYDPGCDCRWCRQEGPSHVCSACGGTGCSVHVDHRASSQRVCRHAPCQVCLGAGRISDAVTREDSIADAETLRMNAAAFHSPERFWYSGNDLTPLLAEAHWQAYMALNGALDFAQERGELAARAAFRAVPGLRGE